MKKYLLIFILFLNFLYAKTIQVNHLTNNEIEFLKKHNTFNLCDQYDIYPMSGTKDGKLIGIMGDYYDEISKRLNINYNVITPNSAKDLNKKVAASKCDLVSMIVVKQKRFKNIKNTKQILTIPYIMMGNIHSKFLDSEADFSNYKFIVRFKVLKKKILKKYPDLDIEVINEMDKVIKKVKNDTNVYFIANKVNIEKTIQKYGFNELKIDGVFEKLYLNITLGVNETNPQLLSILNKTIDQIPKEFIKKSVDKHALKEFKIIKNYDYFWYLFFGFSLVLLLVYSRYRIIINKNIEIEELNNSLEIQTEKLNKAQAIAKLGSWRLDIQNNHLEWSDEIFSIFEIDKNKFEASYEYFINTIHPEDRDMVNNAYAKSIIDKKPYEITHRLVSPEGKIKWVHEKCDTSFDKNGEALVSIGTIQDITDKYLSEQKYKTLLNLASDAILILNNEAKIIESNKQAREYLGYTKQELSTLSIYDLDKNFTKDDHEKVIKLLNDKPISLERIHTRKDQTTYIAQITAIKIKLDNKDYIYTSTRDITNIKQMEDQQRLASMGEMIGNIAHQWRQPLNVISTSASGLKFKHEFIGDLDKDTLYSNLDKIVEQTKYLSQTIDDFRGFIKEDKTYTDISVKDVLNSSLNLVSATLKNNFINLKLQIEDDLIIYGNKNELQQAIINILNNATDFLKANIKRDDDKFIFINTKKISKSELELKILDTAGGIEEKNLKKIFDPYFTTKHKSVGTGLGLSMCDKIIRERHKFNIKVYNEIIKHNQKQFKGACFVITFKTLNEK